MRLPGDGGDDARAGGNVRVAGARRAGASAGVRVVPGGVSAVAAPDARPGVAAQRGSGVPARAGRRRCAWGLAGAGRGVAVGAASRAAGGRRADCGGGGRGGWCGCREGDGGGHGDHRGDGDGRGGVCTRWCSPRRTTRSTGILAAAITRADQLLLQREHPPLPAGLTPHKLRHTFASILVALGHDPASVMAALGHTDPKFTLRIYTHLMRRDPTERARLKTLVDGTAIRPEQERIAA